MAKQNFFFTFRGRIGNMVGVLRGKTYYIRSLPLFVRQTAGMMRAAQRFGKASRMGAIIRRAIVPELDVNFDKSYINQLTKALVPSAGRNLKCLEGFRFNQALSAEDLRVKYPSCEVKTIAVHIHGILFVVLQVKAGKKTAADIIEVSLPEPPVPPVAPAPPKQLYPTFPAPSLIAIPRHIDVILKE